MHTQRPDPVPFCSGTDTLLPPEAPLQLPCCRSRQAWRLSAGLSRGGSHTDHPRAPKTLPYRGAASCSFVSGSPGKHHPSPRQSTAGDAAAAGAGPTPPAGPAACSRGGVAVAGCRLLPAPRRRHGNHPSPPPSPPVLVPFLPGASFPPPRSDRAEVLRPLPAPLPSADTHPGSPRPFQMFSCPVSNAAQLL
ncbi:uncharacterized protein LOC130599707 [Pezoporus wallicus]|uniref:uncharacterized protein LOC130599707 n=1 Tax=Pezoporus wallicus TaxID=35540 RepID=UPI00254BC5E2|nr:uncharacterized protein LOC130599707 [Pezoporus wallicus]